MIKSMTGFGRYESDTSERKIIIEMKSVNHRYLELQIRMPKKLNFFEAGIRNSLKQYISRGKVDIFVTYEDYTEGKAYVKYNEELAHEYYNKIMLMSQTFGLSDEIKAFDLAKLPDVMVLEEQSMNEEQLFELIDTAVKHAARSLVEARISEGESLRIDILSKLNYMKNLVDEIEERSPEINREYINMITNKVKELLIDSRIDENRILTEAALFADKVCTDEETVRLKSHILGMKDALDEGVNVGRKLDFIAQEMNREANTILSKTNDLSITGKAINLKTEIEKIREQIQNIE